METSDQAGRQPSRTILQEGIHDCFDPIWGAQNSETRSTVEDATAIVLARAPLLLEGPRGYTASAVLTALNQAKVGDSTDHFVEDISLGAAKGFLYRGLVDYVKGKGDWGRLQRGVGFAGGATVLSFGLSRDTYTHLFGGAQHTDASPRRSGSTQSDVSGFRSTDYVPRFTKAPAPAPSHRAEVDRMLSFGTSAAQPAESAGDPGHSGAINLSNWQTNPHR